MYLKCPNIYGIHIINVQVESYFYFTIIDFNEAVYKILSLGIQFIKSDFNLKLRLNVGGNAI